MPSDRELLDQLAIESCDKIARLQEENNKLRKENHELKTKSSQAERSASREAEDLDLRASGREENLG